MNKNNNLGFIAFILIIVLKLVGNNNAILNAFGWVAILLLIISVFRSFTIRCEFCSLGWYNFPSSKISDIPDRIRGKNVVNFYPTDIPEKCPNCEALFK
jgi:hypothetical protein